MRPRDVLSASVRLVLLTPLLAIGCEAPVSVLEHHESLSVLRDNEMHIAIAREEGEEASRSIVDAEALEGLRGRLTEDEVRTRYAEHVESVPLPEPEILSRDLVSILERGSGKTRVIVQLNAPGAPIEDLRALARDDEALFVRNVGDWRRGAEHDVLEPFAERLRAMGAEDIQTLWLNPSVAGLVPHDAIRQLATWKEVKRIDTDEHESKPLVGGYTGIEIRAALHIDQFVAAGLDGWQGGRGGAGQIWGVLEGGGLSDLPMANHAGFSILFGRFIRRWDCTSGTCTTLTTNGGDTHATRVAKVLAGSIEAGQDPYVTNPAERLRRSGTAPGGVFAFYAANGTCSAWRASVQQAVLDSVDVLNVSYAAPVSSGNVGTSPCWTNADCGGLNADIRSATAAGTLIVAGLGNDGDPGPTTCNAIYPAMNPNVLAAGGLETGQASSVYDTAPVATYPATPWTPRSGSARAGIDLRLSTGATISRAQAGVDILAPYQVSYFYSSPPYGYLTTYMDAGTSFATPIVAASAGLLRQQFANVGWSNTDARLLHVNVLLMGDSYNYSYGTDYPIGMDSRSGAGRAHFTYPNSPALVAPNGWIEQKFVMASGDTRTFSVGSAAAESTSITQLKSAMLWDEPDPTNAADITLEILNYCPSGGGAPVPVSADWSYDLKKRIELAQGQISGKCLYFRVSAYSMPAGQTRTVYLASFFHSGNPANF